MSGRILKAELRYNCLQWMPSKKQGGKPKGKGRRVDVLVQVHQCDNNRNITATERWSADAWTSRQMTLKQQHYQAIHSRSWQWHLDRLSCQR